MNSPYMGKFKVTQQFKSTHDGLDLVGIDSKEIHSTVNGIVERAGWENPANPKQGFGLYVRIKKDGTNERYYFGHLSKVNVKVGDHVKITQVIGVEGNTGYSFGSHCHYCCRNNASKSEVRNICTISGIPNKLGTYDDGYVASHSTTPATAPTPARKSNEEIAKEVIKGKWGKGADRKQRLTAAGYNYSDIQKIVNKLMK